MYASQNDHSETATLLLTHGSDINATNNKGYTSLVLASQNGHTKTATLLHERGAKQIPLNYESLNLNPSEGTFGKVLKVKFDGDSFFLL